MPRNFHTQDADNRNRVLISTSRLNAKRGWRVYRINGNRWDRVVQFYDGYGEYVTTDCNILLVPLAMFRTYMAAR